MLVAERSIRRRMSLAAAVTRHEQAPSDGSAGRGRSHLGGQLGLRMGDPSFVRRFAQASGPAPISGS